MSPTRTLSLYEERVLEFKRNLLLETFKAYEGNQCAAAAALGIHRNTIRRIMADAGLTAKMVRAICKPQTAHRAGRARTSRRNHA